MQQLSEAVAHPAKGETANSTGRSRDREGKGIVNAGDRQRVIRKILAEYLDDVERQRILRKHIAKVLTDEGATETDRQEIVADIETAASIIGSPTIGAAIEDMVEAVESTPILNVAAG